MSRKTPDHGTPKVDDGRRTFGRWSIVLLGVGLLWAGCGRSTEPVRHEVHKPVSADQPPEIVYPDIPKVPEQIERPSPPIERDSASSR